MVRNVHERVIRGSLEQAGRLLDGLGSPQDTLWPRTVWPALQLDGPLAVGASGGHAKVRYHVEEYEPGRRVRFRFAPDSPLDGVHYAEVEPAGPGRVRMRHVLEGRPRWILGKRTALAFLVSLPIHNAVIEDLLDNAERTLTGTVRRPARWSPYVRLLRHLRARQARRTVAPHRAVDTHQVPSSDR
ncbi:SRPBCC family protein [Streptomyces sp. 8N706]|uniref:SRPBCC family protein n=1 Tax=Streptomyces sp. 8N706 TaxID=3457416 RepID=UPI003FCF6DAB